MKTRIFVLLALLVSLVVFPGLASGEAREVETASSGATFNPLTFVEAMHDFGLMHATSVAVSPDGENVYATGFYDSAVVVFSRDPASGVLTWLEMHTDSPSEDGLYGAEGVAVSPDGENVYVVSYSDDAVAVFSRDPASGLLTWQEVHKDSPGEDGLDGARSVAVSPDGENVYVVSYDDSAVAVFSRDSGDGLLTWREVHKDSPSEDGLGGASSVAVSPDGENVYVAGYVNAAVAVFSRDPDNHGVLTWQEVHKDSLSKDGLSGARSVAVSPDGENVYVAGFHDDAVAVFSRDLGSGLLTWQEVHKDSPSEDGLSGARSVAVSPDGGNVYVAGYGDSAVAVFSRNLGSGLLTWQEVHKDALGEDGLLGANSVAVSLDGESVYATGSLDDAAVAFGRDGTNGRLTFLQAYKSAPGLAGAVGVAVSPDGTYVYVAGNDDDSIAAFRRDKASGTLGLTDLWDSSFTDGLDGARAVAVSPDGANVYVAGYNDDAVTVFDFDASLGYLNDVEMVQDEVDGVDGLDGPQALAVSPDGANVYVAGYNDDAVAIFSRSVITGGLTYEGVFKDGAGADGLNGAYAVAVSPDGAHVYVAGYVDDAVAIFSRDLGTGDLTYKSMVKDGDVVPSVVTGLDGANSLAFSPDGVYLYVASRSEDAVAVFQRDPSTGSLYEIEVQRDGIGGVEGLNGARAVAVSPDGSQVYVASQTSNALAVFARDEYMGDLFYVGMHQNNVNGVEGLDTANGLAVSPDGGHVYVTGYADDAVAVFARWRVYMPLALR